MWTSFVVVITDLPIYTCRSTLAPASFARRQVTRRLSELAPEFRPYLVNAFVADSTYRSRTSLYVNYHRLVSYSNINGHITVRTEFAFRHRQRQGRIQLILWPNTITAVQDTHSLPSPPPSPSRHSRPIPFSFEPPEAPYQPPPQRPTNRYSVSPPPVFSDSDSD